MQEQMIPTRIFLQLQSKNQETTTCKLCEAHPEGKMHWMSACPYLAGSEYLKRHNQALKVFYVAPAKKFGLLDLELAWFNVHLTPIKKITKHHFIGTSRWLLTSQSSIAGQI